jgi:hypothetical protein
MKKFVYKTGLGVALALSLLAGCSNKDTENSSHNSVTKPKDVRTTVIKEPAEEAPVENANEPMQPPMQGSLACSSEDDCALVPNGDCFGCMKPGGSHIVTTQQQASKMWEQKRATCEPQLKQFFSSQPKKEEMSQDPSCKAFNGVACQQGQCVGVLLNEAQLKARAEKMRQRMGGQAGGGPSSQPNQPNQPHQAGQPAQPSQPMNRPMNGQPNMGGGNYRS